MYNAPTIRRRDQLIAWPSQQEKRRLLKDNYSVAYILILKRFNILMLQVLGQPVTYYWDDRFDIFNNYNRCGIS